MTVSNDYPRWCEILRSTAVQHGRSQPEIAAAAGIGLGKIKRIWNNHEVPSADDMLQLCEVLDLPKVRMLAELGKVESEAGREAYIDQLEELASRTQYSAGMVQVEQLHGAAVIAARIVARGGYRVTIAPLIQGTGRFRRHYDDLVAIQPLPGQDPDDLRQGSSAWSRLQRASVCRPPIFDRSSGFRGSSRSGGGPGCRQNRSPAASASLEATGAARPTLRAGSRTPSPWTAVISAS
jgi:transcriptional regulator with XRE-family HTH domain